MIFLFALILLFAPRLALFLVWVLTPIVSRAYGTFIVPLLGFLFLPLTTLVYALVYVPSAGGPVGFGWLWVALGFLLDIGAYTGSVYRKSGRSEQQPMDRAA